MHIARWAHMNRFLSICHWIINHWIIIHISKSIIGMSLKLYHSNNPLPICKGFEIENVSNNLFISRQRVCAVDR